MNLKFKIYKLKRKYGFTNHLSFWQVIQYKFIEKFISDDVLEEYVWDNNLLDEAYRENWNVKEY